MKYSHIQFENATVLSENRYLMAAEKDAATLFALSNGYLGVRGSLEEANTMLVQGAYIRGMVGYCPCRPIPTIENEYMKKWYFNEDAIRRYDTGLTFVNYADILYLLFEINGETFYPWEGKVLSWKRSLDMASGELVRTVRWENSKGEITGFIFRRFASYADDHTFAIKVEVTPENYSGTIRVTSGFDTVVKSDGWVITLPKEESCENGRVYYSCDSCKEFPLKISAGCALNLYDGGDKIASCWEQVEGDGIIAEKTEISVNEGKTVTAEKIIYVISERDTDRKPEDAVRDNGSFDLRYDTLFNTHLSEFKRVFDDIDVKIEGDDKADRGLRFSNFHTLGTANRNDSVHSLAPKGLTGDVYGGMVWWDCEVYQSPFFYTTLPDVGKNFLLYRYRMLEQARRNAELENCRGARYPFNSGITGKELVYPVARHPAMQIHVVSDVAWSVCNYYACTGDDEFMIDYGMEILYETARYWVDRSEKDERGYIINQVTGPDEQHPYVDNNAYTNYCVCYTLNRTLELDKTYGEKLNKVREKINLTSEDLSAFKDVADNIYLPIEKDSGLIPQFDGYLSLSRELKYGEGDVKTLSGFQLSSGLYHESQVIKQPDVLVLFAYQNFRFNDKIYSRNWDYYRARCESLSSLSYSVHSICASDNCEPDSAYDLFLHTAYMDLDDSHNCAFQGIHAACAAGARMAAVRGIAGTVHRFEGVEINPSMIPWWKSISYSVRWHGQKLNVTVTNGEVTVVADKDNKGVAKLMIGGKPYELLANETANVSISLENDLNCKF